jgi:hypothetical protein
MLTKSNACFGAGEELVGSEPRDSDEDDDNITAEQAARSAAINQNIFDRQDSLGAAD